MPPQRATKSSRLFGVVRLLESLESLLHDFSDPLFVAQAVCVDRGQAYTLIELFD